MHRVAVVPLLFAASSAFAGWPQDVTPSEMTEHAGRPIQAPVTDDYAQLVRELGTAVANKPFAPADTLGAFGFDFSISNSFVFINARGEPDKPSPWERASPDEDPMSTLFLPSLSVRKGFAGSLEAGASMSWLGLSRQGTFSGFGRLGIVEGWKPYPDVTLQWGYSGYIGNQELDVGVVDLGVRVGSTFAFGTFPGVNTGQFQPWIDYTALRARAVHHVDAETAATIGAVNYSGTRARDGFEPALVMHRLSGGFQITNGTVFLRTVGSWTFGSAPSVQVGMGFTY